MPAPQAMMVKEMAKNNFRSKGIKLGHQWSQPTGEAGKQYVDAFEQGEHNVPPDPMALFTPATPNKYHVDQTKTIGKQFADFIDGVSDAICGAWQQFMSASTIVGVMVNGPVGVIMPGSFQGPPIFPLAFAQAPKNTPSLMKYSKAVCQAVGTSFQAWHMGFMGKVQCVPTFAVMAGPIHPPTPNIPMTIDMVGKSPAEAMMKKDALKGLMILNLGDPTALHHMELFDSIADAIDQAFTQFKASTMVNNIMSFGPIPTFAPPFVPVGPVVMGVGNGIPGSMLA